jgi:hypothetical protein
VGSPDVGLEGNQRRETVQADIETRTSCPSIAGRNYSENGVAASGRKQMSPDLRTRCVQENTLSASFTGQRHEQARTAKNSLHFHINQALATLGLDLAIACKSYN